MIRLRVFGLVLVRGDRVRVDRGRAVDRRRLHHGLGQGRALAACENKGPSSFNVTAHGKAPQVNFHSAPPPADSQEARAAEGSDEPDGDRNHATSARAAFRRAPRACSSPRSQGLENLFRTTPQNAPDRVQLARRLAEDYVELESAAFSEKTRAEIDRDSLKKTNPQAAGQKQAIANQANHIMLAARQKVIDNYTLIINQYSDYSLLDEVLYYLAYEYEQSNDLVNARRVYYDLIKQKPNSKFIPNAYLAFGELFFNEAQGDPSKWDFAAQAYTEVIKFPPEKSKVYGYAWYKLAYVFWNKGEIDEGAQRLQEDDRLRRRTSRSTRARASSRTPRGVTSSPSTRSRATRRPRTTSSTTSRATRAVRTTRRST